MVWEMDIDDPDGGGGAEGGACQAGHHGTQQEGQQGKNCRGYEPCRMVDQEGDGPRGPPQGGDHADEQEEEQDGFDRLQPLEGHGQQSLRFVALEEAVGEEKKVASQQSPEDEDIQGQAGGEKGAKAPQKEPFHLHPSLLFLSVPIMIEENTGFVQISFPKEKQPCS